jgi:hypothetical protein
MSPVIGLFSNRPSHQPFPPMGGYRPYVGSAYVPTPRCRYTPSVPAPKGGDAVSKYRRFMVSLGWLAAFMMAVGNGWKNN